MNIPVEKDSHFAYARIGCPDTSVVTNVLKPMLTSDMSERKIRLLDIRRENLKTCDRVFDVFNLNGFLSKNQLFKAITNFHQNDLLEFNNAFKFMNL
jgi:hypothetical protein